MATTDLSVQCAPRYATRARTERATWGPYWGRVARSMGKPFMPWQQQVADIAGETDKTGRLMYNEIVITVPRQSGKTTLLLSVVVGRAEAGPSFGGRQRMLYAAQTREDARAKWLEDYVEDLRASKVMRGKFIERIANGSEKITFKSSRSTFGPIATKETSGHGKVLDWGALDEAFSQTDGAVEASWLPAMITRPMAQFWVPSTAGTDASVYFRKKVDAGRLAVVADAGEGVAYFEWSTPEDFEDYADEDNWRRCMPALGFTQNLDAIRREFIRMDLNDFRRAFLNQWVGKTTPSVIPSAWWRACADPTSIRATRPVIAIDVSADREWASLAIAGERADGLPIVRVIHHQQGTDWVVDKVEQLRDEHDPAAIVLDGASPARSLISGLQDRYIEPTVLQAGDMVAACGQFYDAVKQGRIRHYGDAPLEKAITAAERRELGDAWAWTRKKSLQESGADISPLVAVTCALWAQAKFGDHAGFDLSASFG
jgi:phage terminase large subunit-like protein